MLDDDHEFEAWLDENDDELPDDYFVVRGADRSINGQFSVWYKRRYYADGRKKLECDRLEELARKIGALAKLAVSNYASDWLPAIAQMKREVELLEYEAVAIVRSYGWPWRVIAKGLDLSTASAHRRFGQLEFDFRRRRRG